MVDSIDDDRLGDADSGAADGSAGESGDSSGGRSTFGLDSAGGDGDGSASASGGTPPSTTNDSGASDGGSNGSAGGDDGSETFDCSNAPSFATDVWPLFDGRCDGGNCHQNGDVNFGLNLDEGSAFDQMVKRPAVEVTATYLVDPGDAAASYLYRKLVGDHDDAGGYGMRMPIGQAAYSASDLSSIAAWIDAGACP
jgi:hypothetical protein